ncbi:hypothetical protein [Paenibacillus silvisoli]|uniref:hypothetical protein n=1 Tax=Paenibacillus silvisoli TaxID=3110539 RepID=UPI0028057BCD|nr:hypothetical protein [Paenibacillus silvisoli]
MSKKSDDGNRTIIKSVSFNLDDPDELATYKHAMQRSNFSRYVKCLIEIDMLRGRIALLGQVVQEKAPADDPEEPDTNIIANSIGGFL